MLVTKQWNNKELHILILGCKNNIFEECERIPPILYNYYCIGSDVGVCRLIKVS